MPGDKLRPLHLIERSASIGFNKVCRATIISHSTIFDLPTTNISFRAPTRSSNGTVYASLLRRHATLREIDQSFKTEDYDNGHKIHAYLCATFFCSSISSCSALLAASSATRSTVSFTTDKNTWTSKPREMSRQKKKRFSDISPRGMI